MSELEDIYIYSVEIRKPPFLFAALLRVIGHRLFGVPAPSWTIDWKETLLDIVGRFFAGLVVGIGLCILLIPVLFLRTRARKITALPKHSLFQYLGEPSWIGWLFLGVWIGTGLLWALTTRANLRATEPPRRATSGTAEDVRQPPDSNFS